MLPYLMLKTTCWVVSSENRINFTKCFRIYLHIWQPLLLPLLLLVVSTLWVALICTFLCHHIMTEILKLVKASWTNAPSTSGSLRDNVNVNKPADLLVWLLFSESPFATYILFTRRDNASWQTWTFRGGPLSKDHFLTEWLSCSAKASGRGYLMTSSGLQLRFCW